DPAVATLSAAFFVIPDDQITQERGNRAFVANMARRGLRAAILPAHGARNPDWIDQEFLRNPAYGSLLDKPPLSLVELPSANERLVAHARRSLGENPITIVLMQACPPESKIPALIRFGTLLFFGAFLAAWFLFLINDRIWKRPVRIGLKAQMLGAFLVMILPIVLQGMLFLERSFSEQAFRFRSDRIHETEAVARNLDRTLPVYLGCFLNLIQGRLDEPAFRAALAKVADGGETGVVDSASLLAWQLYKDLASAGVVLKDPIIGGADFFGSNFAWDSKKGTLLQRKLLFDGPASVLQRFNAGRANAGAKSSFEDMIVSASTDQLRTAMSSVVSTELLADEYLGLRFFTQISLSRDLKNSTMVRLFLFDQGVPRFSFLALVPYQSVLYQPLMTWNRSRSELLPGDLPGVSAVHRSLPAVIPDAPFWTANPTTQDGSLSFSTCFRLSPAVFSEPAMQAFQAQTTLSRFIPQGRDTILMSVLPRTEGDQTAFVAFSPFSRELARELEANARGRLLLLLLVVLCFGASWYASESFLRPVLDLSAAARQIRAGNFKARLSGEFEGEFGLLAGSFNAMARGVEEGRLLSRFVSESVRMTARSRGNVDGSDRGTVINVTVIFAGLSGFKALMAAVPPEDLVERLNICLETMSGIIRAHDGEIDKFIGDKILAVFHEAGPGSGDSARKAVSAALAMREAMRALESRIGSSIGIGIVTGSVLSGILGTAEVRLEHTILGDTVNLASRLGDIAQKLDPDGAIGTVPGGGIVIEAETRRLLADFPAAIHPLKLPPIKGKTRAVEAYLVTPPCPS
ncbi:MAG TPA: adenylate/guanylate cyclase domain-containing protein, partial [Candidatus Ozemobacteraceae bacterium]|nr:adenylate/guanylate cyclase domain-containing protein [Candidatus Ozemobacteraceae bacterium]